LACPGLMLIIPLILALFMENRNHSRWRTSREDRESTKMR
jgi:hypothetical protein